MNIIFSSKWVRFGVDIGRQEDDDDSFEVIRNTGGDFSVADDDAEDDFEVPQYDDRFGFAGGT